MASTIDKVTLSGSVDGRAIDVLAVLTPGTPIHTAHLTSIDEVWLYAVNNTLLDAVLTIEFGDAVLAHNIVATVKAGKGLVAVCPGLVLTNGATVAAFTPIASSLKIIGFVNRIT